MFTQFHSQNVQIGDNMKITRLPLPTNNLGSWNTNYLTTSQLQEIFNSEEDAIEIYDSPDIGGVYTQKAISIGIRKESQKKRVFFSAGSAVEANLNEKGIGFVSDDQAMAVIEISISFTGSLEIETLRQLV